jgi:hypothetical protein
MTAETDFMASLETWLQSRMEQVHTMLPGVVQSYDAETRHAVVRPAVRLRDLHGNILDIGPIAGVPVVWPGTADFTLRGRLEPGDGVMLLCAEAGIGGWALGTEDMDADDETRHSLHDAVAVPGLWQVRRVPAHDLRGALYGVAGTNAVLGATEAGKLVLENEVSSLRSEIERLWDLLQTMETRAATQFTALATAAGTGTTAALVPGLTALAEGATEDLSTVATGKAALGEVLQ